MCSRLFFFLSKIEMVMKWSAFWKECFSQWQSTALIYASRKKIDDMLKFVIKSLPVYFNGMNWMLLVICDQRLYHPTNGKFSLHVFQSKWPIHEFPFFPFGFQLNRTQIGLDRNDIDLCHFKFSKQHVHVRYFTCYLQSVPATLLAPHPNFWSTRKNWDII